MKFSPDVLDYLCVITAAQSVGGDRPDFDEAAALLGKTRRELLAAVAEQEAAKPAAKTAKKVTHNGRTTKAEP